MILALALAAATPATLPAVLARAKGGERIVLAPGDYGIVTIARRRFSPPLTVEGRDARMTLVMRNAGGVRWQGVQFGPTATGYAASVRQSRDVQFTNVRFIDSPRGLVIDRSTDVVVSRARFSGMTIDGVDIASSQRITIADSVCTGFNTGELHPDCIQAWSRPATGITADIRILRNRVSGTRMQGIYFGNIVRNGVDDGGFDRVTIAGNEVEGNYPQGIGLYDCRVCTVTDNVVRTLPGARWRTSIRLIRGSVADARNSVGPKR